MLNLNFIPNTNFSVLLSYNSTDKPPEETVWLVSPWSRVSTL